MKILIGYDGYKTTTSHRINTRYRYHRSDVWCLIFEMLDRIYRQD